MDDYLSEKEQWEAVKAWIRDNGLWIVAGVAIAAAGLSGWRWYQGHLDEVGSRASAKYNDIIQAFGRDDVSQAFVYLGELEREYPSSPYADQAKMAAARSYVESSQLDKAAAELQAVAEHSKDADLALIARLRLARVQIAQQKADAALATLSAVKPGAFASRYHEAQGDAYYAKGDKANALKEYIGAKADGLGTGEANSVLDLKISDLSAALAKPAPASAVPAGSASAPPGKPTAATATPTTTNSGGAASPATAATSK